MAVPVFFALSPLPLLMLLLLLLLPLMVLLLLEETAAVAAAPDEWRNAPVMGESPPQASHSFRLLGFSNVHLGHCHVAVVSSSDVSRETGDTTASGSTPDDAAAPLDAAAEDTDDDLTR